MWAWGDNFYGQLADGTNINHNVPKKVGNDSDWLNVSAGNGHTHAVKTNETAWGCGGNSDGRVGDGTQVNKISFVQIGLGSTWKSISSGNHTMAIRTDGTIWSCGANNKGQQGDGTLNGKLILTQIGIDTNWKIECPGFEFGFGVKSDSSVWSWGYNQYGQLGLGDTLDKLVPTYVQSECPAPLGINNFNTKQSTIHFYPNPANGIINIDCKAVDSKSLLRVFDCVGHLVFSEIIAPQQQVIIDVSKFKKGV